MNRSLLILIAISSAIFFTCRKSNNAGAAKSQWTIGGMTYTGDTTYFNPGSSYQDVESFAGSGNSIAIPFKSRPVADGIFSVIGASSGPADPDSNQCMVFVAIGTSYYHSFETKGTVAVTLVDGKINLHFSNVEVTNLTDTTTVSGQLFER